MTEKTREQFLDELEQLDRFLEGKDPGVIPIEVLAERGMTIPASEALEDGQLEAKLWELIEALASIGIYLGNTDHLSDRELYDFLRNDALVVPTILFPDNPAHGEHIDPIGGCSNNDIRVYLRYYADEETRAQWREDFPDDEQPPHEDPPYDRDRFLPTHEERLFGAQQ